MGKKRTKAQTERRKEQRRKRYRSIRRVENILNDLSGHLNRQKFLSVFENSSPMVELPYWLYRVIKPSSKNAAAGVDAIAETDCGIFFLKIKSSELRAMEFRSKERNKHIPVVVTFKNDTPEFIRYETINTLKEARDKILGGTEETRESKKKRARKKWPLMVHYD